MGKVKKANKTESKEQDNLKNVAEKSKKNLKKAKIADETTTVDVKGTIPLNLVKKEKKQEKKKNKNAAEKTTENETDKKPDPKELDAKALAKIEKKKAKKLAKKLKKKQLKEQEKDDVENVKLEIKENGQTNIDKKGSPKKQGHVKDTEKSAPKTNAQQKAQKIKSPNKPQDVKEHTPRDPAVTARTIFIGNLPTTTKRVQIIKLLAKFGTVESIRLRTAAGQVIFKHKQRKLAGSLNAYVVLPNAEAAQKALELNGMAFKSNHLRVTPADAQKTQSSHDPKRTILVGNLKYSANENKLHEIFSNCGEIDYIRCLLNGKNGCNGVAYVCFKSAEAVGLALELNETLLDERPIHVERYSTKKLGAKVARDKEAAANHKPKPSGAKKRIDGKQQRNDNKSFDKKKKSEFRGVKTNAMKNKKHNKKPNKEMKGLAKKIAPKIKRE